MKIPVRTRATGRENIHILHKEELAADALLGFVFNTFGWSRSVARAFQKTQRGVAPGS